MHVKRVYIESKSAAGRGEGRRRGGDLQTILIPDDVAITKKLSVFLW